LGAFGGAQGAKALGDYLTGGDTPDKLGPPLTLPADVALQPTITLADGSSYALVEVEGKYTWFTILDNSSLNLASPYIEVVSGQRMAELTSTYLQAAGFPDQLADYNAQLAEQQRQTLQDAFSRSEIEYANSIGPDGLPWGTTTPIAPNATQTWSLSPQPGQVLNTLEVRNADGSITRIVQSIDRASGVVVAEQSYENPDPSNPDGFRLVGSSDYQSGAHWSLDRDTGVMEQTGYANGVMPIDDGYAPDGSPLGQSAIVEFNGTTYASVWTRDPDSGRYTETETATTHDENGNVTGSATTVRTYGANGESLGGEVSRYDAQGRLIESESLNPPGVADTGSADTADAGASPEFEEALLDAFGNPTRPEGEGIQVADNGGVWTDGGQQIGHLEEPNPYDFGNYLDGAGANLSASQQQGLAMQLDSLNLGGTGDLSFITLPGGSTTLIQNADGDIVGEIQQDANGYARISAVRINEDGSAEQAVSYVGPRGEVIDPDTYAQAQSTAQAQQTAAALGLLNSIIGLQNWDAMSDLQRTAALAGIYNAVDHLTGGGTLPGDLGTAAGVLGLLNALDQGNIGGVVYSGLSLVESLTATSGIANSGLVSDALGGNFLPALGFVLALDSGDPWAIGSSGVALLTALEVIPVWGQALAVAIAVFGAFFDSDIPMREGLAHAEWDAQGQTHVVTDLDEKGGGATATGWMQALTDGLQSQLSDSGYALVPGLLPAVGFKYDPDGFNLRNGAKGFLYLEWTDEDGQVQTRYYDGAGNRSDGSGETLAGDFVRHAMGAIAPAWAVETALAHWQQGEGVSLPDVRDGLPKEVADGLTQQIEAFTLALPDEPVLRAALVDVDGDGYLEQTQWVAANQQLLAIDVNGDGFIGAGELLNLGDADALNGAGWLDANGDGRLDAKDPAFAALRLWMDTNGDGLSGGSAGGELQTFEQAGISAIDLASNPPAVVRADGSRQALTAQMLDADRLGVAYQATAGGILQVSEQADGSGVAVLAAVNTQEFDGQAGHVHGGDADTDGGNATVDAGDEDLFGTSARTPDSENVQTATTLGDGDGRIQAGATGSTQAGQGRGQREAVPGSASVRSNGIVFVPVEAQGGRAQVREATAGMVRSVESNAMGGSDGMSPLLAVALGAVVQWPAVADAQEIDDAGGAPAPAPAPLSPPGALTNDGSGSLPLPEAAPSVAAPGSYESVSLLLDGAALPPSGAHAEGAPTEVLSVEAFGPSAGVASTPVPSVVVPASVVSVPSSTPEGGDAGAANDAGAGMVDFPTVAGEYAQAKEDVGLRFAEALLLANDATVNTPPAGRAALAITSVFAPQHGRVSLQVTPDGTEVVFIPDADYHGPASFDYTVSDAYGLSRTATVTLEIEAVNDAPVVRGESAQGDEDQVLMFTAASLLANDSDVDGDVLRITGVGAAEHGQVFLLDDGMVRFVPDADYHGPASFGYTVSDVHGLFRTATVTLEIEAVNDAPVVRGESARGDEDQVLTFTAASLLANDSDVDGDVLRITRVGAAEHGDVFLLDDGTVRFVPDADYHGPASFGYTVSDVHGLFRTATVTLEIEAVNDAPVARGESAQGDEDQVLMFTAASLLANDSDVDGDVLRITRVGAAEHGQVFLLADGTVRFVPDADYHGPARFSYWVGDRDPAAIVRGEGFETEATLDLTVLPVNDLPVVAGEEIDSDEDVVLSIAPALLLANDRDVDSATDAQVLAITAVGGAQHGEVALLPDGSIRFTPERDYAGAASFAYTVDDGHGGRVQGTAVIHLAPVNDAPVVVGETIAFDEDEIQMIDAAALLANDSDVDNPHAALRIVAVDNATHGTVALDANGAIRFVPEADYFGAASFTYTVADGAGGFTVGTASLEISPVNDAPRLVGEQVALDEDTVARFTQAALLANDLDVDDAHSALSVSAVGGATHGTVTLANGEIVFKPYADFNGRASFTYTVTDGSGGSSEATVELDFAPVNDAPVANDELLWGKQGVTYTLTQAALLANDTDAEDPADLRVVGIDNVQHGSAVLNADGSVTFTPEAGYAGRGSFSYVVQDPDGARSTAEAQIDFSHVNVNPTATDDSFTGYEDVAFSIAAGQLLANDSDADNAAADLRVTGVANAVNGTVSMDADGNVSFAPAADFHGTASFQYQVSDPEGGQTWATAYLNVQSVNDAPIIEDIWYGRPIYGYRWEVDTMDPRTPFHLVAVQDEATALALFSDPSDVVSFGSRSRSNDLMDANGNPIGVSYYLNGHLRPIAFDTLDGTQPPRLGPSPVDSLYRENGAVIAYDPDGDSGSITFSVGVTPQHGLAWANQYVPASVLTTVDHTAINNWIVETGAWQYYSFRGDTYSGADPFTIVVTDSEGASTSATVAATHAGSSPSGGGSCPIVIDLRNDGIELLRPEDSSVFMDINGDGWRDRIGWAAPSDAVLAFDADGDGRVDIDTEVSFVGYLPGARTDLEGLAAFDTDGDGRLTAQDGDWSRFGLFQDRNGNGLQDEGEFVSLDAAGLVGIDLARQGEPAMNNGNVVFGTSTVQWADGRTSQAGDVMFAGEGIALPQEVAQLFPVPQPEADAAAIQRVALLFNQAVNTAVADDARPLAFVSMAGDVHDDGALLAQMAMAGAEALAVALPA
jgi:hypothetical protein